MEFLCYRPAPAITPSPSPFAPRSAHLTGTVAITAANINRINDIHGRSVKNEQEGRSSNNNSDNSSISNEDSLNSKASSLRNSTQRSLTDPRDPRPAGVVPADPVLSPRYTRERDPDLWDVLIDIVVTICEARTRSGE
jgi:hypothetical protein